MLEVFPLFIVAVITQKTTDDWLKNQSLWKGVGLKNGVLGNAPLGHILASQWETGDASMSAVYNLADGVGRVMGKW